MACIFYLSVYIDKLEENTIVIGATADEPSRNLKDIFGDALVSLGVDIQRPWRKMYRGSFVFIAMKGERQRATMKMRPRKCGPCILAHTFVYGPSAGRFLWLMSFSKLSSNIFLSAKGVLNHPKSDDKLYYSLMQ